MPKRSREPFHLQFTRTVSHILDPVNLERVDFKPGSPRDNGLQDGLYPVKPLSRVMKTMKS